MSAKLSITGSGKILDDSLINYSYREDASSLDPSSIDGGVSQVSISAIEVTPDKVGNTHPNSKLMINNAVTLVDSTKGSIDLTIDKVSTNDSGVVSFSGSTAQRRLNVIKKAAAFSGTLKAAIEYYCSLCGVTPTYFNSTISSALGAENVNFIGWEDNVWSKLKELTSAYITFGGLKIEIIANQSSITIKQALTTAFDSANRTSFSQEVNTTDSARTVDVNYYLTSYAQNKPVFDISNYDTPASSTDKKFLSTIADSMQVDAGATLKKRVKIDATLTSVNQPNCVAKISQIPYSGGSGNVSGATSVGSTPVATWYVNTDSSLNIKYTAGQTVTVSSDNNVYFNITLTVAVGGTNSFTAYYNYGTNIGTQNVTDGKFVTNTIGEYAVVGSDGLVIQPSQWIGQGGSLTVALTDVADEIELTIVAPKALSLPTSRDPNKASYGPYKIGVESSGDTDYPAIWITGTGVFFQKKTMNFITGAGDAVTSKTSGPTIDNIFINRASSASTIGVIAAQQLCGPDISISMDIADTLQFGALTGAVYPINSNEFRLVSVDHSYDKVSVTGKMAAQISDFNTKWTGRSFSTFTSTALSGSTYPNDALKFNEFTVIPLMAAPEEPVQVNLVDNPSFTSASITGWTGDSVSRFTPKFKTSPASLYIDNPDTDANAMYQKIGALTIGQSYSLSLWVGGVGNFQGAVITFYAGTASKTLTIPARDDTNWTYYKIENVVCTGNTNITIYYNSPANAYLDDVSIVAGITAV
jgi:hypothetical protein